MTSQPQNMSVEVAHDSAADMISRQTDWQELGSADPEEDELGSTVVPDDPVEPVDSVDPVEPVSGRDEEPELPV
jgi:hypothetical protein